MSAKSRMDGWMVTRLKEHPIYGSDRLGLDLNEL
jgi:hypothetical protein